MPDVCNHYPVSKAWYDLIPFVCSSMLMKYLRRQPSEENIGIFFRSLPCDDPFPRHIGRIA